VTGENNNQLESIIQVEQIRLPLC